MKNDQLKQFIALRASLLEEKAGLLSRLAQIEEALGPGTVAPGKRMVRRAVRGAQGARPEAGLGAKPARKTARRRRARRKGDQLPLPEFIRQLVASGPLAKDEIIEALKKAKRSFSPGYLQGVLYSRKLRRVAGKFAAA